MSNRSKNLCVCSHRRKKHFNGQCEECNRACQYKEGSEKNVIPQRRASGGGATGENVDS